MYNIQYIYIMWYVNIYILYYVVCVYIYIFTLRIPLNPSVPSEEVFRVWFGGWFATSEVAISHIKRPSRYQSWTSGTVRKIIELPSWKHWNRHLYWVATHDSQSPIHWLFYFSLICQLYIYIYIFTYGIYIYMYAHVHMVSVSLYYRGTPSYHPFPWYFPSS